MRKKAPFILVGLLLFTAMCKAQQPYMWHLTEDDGLPSMEVYNLLQDKKGYIWMGTDNGVCRYDGHSFKLYYNPKQKGKSFSHFLQDKKERLWCINFAGQIFYIENDSLKLFEPFERVYKNGFPRLTITPDNTLWIVTDGNGVFSYDLETGKFTNHPSMYRKYYVNIVCDSAGNVIVQSDNNLVFRNGKMVKQFPSEMLGLQSSRETGEIFMVSAGRNNVVLKKVDMQKGAPVPFDVSAFKDVNAQVLDIVSFGTRENWLLTLDGAYHFTREGNVCQNIIPVLKGNIVSWAIKDREGNYWLSTLKNGVFVIPSMHVWYMNSGNSRLPNDRVIRIEQDRNRNLYLAGVKNVIEFDKKQNKIRNMVPISQSSKDIELLRYDNYRNKMYGQAQLFFEIDLGSLKVKNRGAGLSSIKDIRVDNWGNMLVTNSYFSSFIPLGSKASPFIPYFGKTTLHNDYHLHVLREQRGVCNYIYMRDTSLWIAFIDGLYTYKNGTARIIKDEAGAMIYATRISESPDGTLWISTVQQGLYAYKDGKVKLHLTKATGLMSDYIRCVRADRDFVWFATDKGVQGYDTRNHTLLQFTREDGLITNDVLDISAHESIVYLATSKGFEWFDYKQLRVNKVKPTVFIDRFLVNDSARSSRAGELSYRENNISIRFTGIALRSRGAMKYAYRLLGLDTSWHALASNENTARFNTLPAGEYTFQVKAVNEDGIESVPAAVVFKIRAPYWQRWWFVVLVAIVFAAVISLVFLIRIRIIRRRNKLETDKAKLEVELRSSQLSALKVQMNPHFIFNALNSIQEYILTNEKKLANSYLGKFSDLMRLYLDMSNKNAVSLEEEIKAMKLYLELEAMRFEERFIYEMNVSEELERDEIYIPAMIIQPYVENAIKHGLLHQRNDRRLTVTFTAGKNKTLVCEVTDNGIGRKQSYELNRIRKSHVSFATGATQKRLELLNAERDTQIGVQYDDLYHKDGSVLGTKVTLTIPWS